LATRLGSGSGLKLFVANGYEATTLEAVAAAAGISRRTFFHYFKSKEELLLAWQGHPERDPRNDSG
jgi:hypothetical protein